MLGIKKPKSPYKVLSSNDVEAIHEASLRVLKETGVIFDHPEAIDYFKEAGAAVTGNLVRIPPQLVAEAIEQSPDTVLLRAREPEKSFIIGADRIFFSGPFGATFVLDIDSGVRRRAALNDLRLCTRIADQLENAHACLAGVIPQDIPGELDDLYSAAVMMENTSKHVNLRVSGATYNDAIIEIGMIASDGEPCFSLGTGPMSPLNYPCPDLDKLIAGVKKGIPYRIVAAPLAGATAPVTLAGCLTLLNAEVLAGATLAQLVRPGNPVLYGSFAGVMDMRSGIHLLGSPEFALLNAAIAQLCRFYSLPFGYATGGQTDSKLCSQRAAMEKMATVLLPALAAADLVHDGAAGLIDSGNTLSFEQMLIDDEICSYISRIVEGIKVDSQHIAVDIIHEVGPGGKFLSHRHTAKNLRKELYLSRFWDDVVGDNEKDMMRKLREHAQILANKELEHPLDPRKSIEIKKVIDLAVKGKSQKL